ncbi:MAG: DUF503 domain-containing protein [Deltaproteobacteria bacterium]
MYVSYGYAELYLPYSHSLKEKRGKIHGVTSRIRKRFNVSVAEVDHNDLWQRSRLGFSAISHDIATLELIINSIRDSLQDYSDELEMINIEYEIVTY